MPIFSRLIYESVKWRARRGRYLRRHGYVFVARNYVPRGAKGEIDMVGFDGETLAFVEVRTRTAREDQAALPELSVTAEKQYLVGRTARRFYINVT